MSKFQPKKLAHIRNTKAIRIEVNAEFYAVLKKLAKKNDLTIKEFIKQSVGFAIDSLENGERS